MPHRTQKRPPRTYATPPQDAPPWVLCDVELTYEDFGKEQATMEEFCEVYNRKAGWEKAVLCDGEMKILPDIQARSSILIIPRHPTV